MIKIFIELYKYEVSDSYYVKEAIQMKKENVLKFSQKRLFNNTILQQYDEQTQRFLLGFIMINESWKIEDDSIVFSNIKTQKQVQEIVKRNEETIKQACLILKQSQEKN